ncbi:zinc-dependent alcohol dehydrogenase [Micromonospora lutea]|uniref:Alcohol dehydrogenase n=1 Tax=Micromonospora lutea TaxID=419825 RepID=A0ABQ4ISG1_9ACTN|nr:alcohol dehydrogenase catalytic domain-containing protein [Micromonospora lutea]GIJ20857.1 alcohol dehydrogenase [Micromonospora lutea]
MKALIYSVPGETEVREVPDAVIQEPTDAIVDVIATSICGSDLHVVSGDLVPDTGFILGHEMVGRIRELGSAVKNFSVGDRVTVSPAPYCGVCASCRRGNYAHCQFGGVYGCGETYGGFAGSHAERLRIPFAARDMIRVPDHVSDESALAISDALTTGAGGVTKAVTQQGRTIAVFGCGPVGLSAIHYATIWKPAKLIAIDLVPERLEIARQMGATDVISAADPREELQRITGGVGVDAAIDCAGVEATFQAAIDSLAPEGFLSIIGIPHKPVSFDIAGALRNGLNLWTGLADVGPAQTIMDYIADGLLNPDAIFNHETTLDEAPALIKTLMTSRDHGIVKAVIRP